MSIFKPLKGLVNGKEKSADQSVDATASEGKVMMGDSSHEVTAPVKAEIRSRTRYSAQEKWLIIREGELEGPKAVCERYGISVWSWRNWQKRRDDAISDSDALGLSGLEDKGSVRAGARGGLAKGTEEEIVKEQKRCPGLGPSQIRNQLRRRGIRVSVKSVRRVMMREGYKPPDLKTHTEEPKRFEAERPRQLVQMDILEFYIHKEKVRLLLLLDDNSRFIIGWGLFEEANMEHVMGVFEEMVKKHGKPESVLTDRAMVFYAWKGMNRFQKMLEGYEIDHIVASAHHPQTLGKIEAVNKNIQKELIRKVEFVSFLDAQEKIGEWIHEYNHRRTHQGIGGVLVPADRFYGREEDVLEKIERQEMTGDESAGISTMYEPDIAGRQITVLQVTRTGEEISLWVLGRKVTLNSGR